MILWVLLVVVGAWYVIFRYKRRDMYRLASALPPLSEELPIIGVAHSLAGNTEDIMKSLQRFSYAAMKNDGCVRMWLNHVLYTVLINPTDLDVILKTFLEKYDLHRFFKPLLGNGTVFAPVSTWRSRRKILVPAFSPKIMENFVEVFAEQSDTLAKRFINCANGRTFSVWPYISTYTLDSVCETAMGVKLDAQGNPDLPFLKAINGILNLICERICHLWLQPAWLFKMLPKSRAHDKWIAELHEVIDSIIKKRRGEISTEILIKKELDQEFESSYKRKTFLDHLSALSGGEKGYSKEELREEVLTLVMAGTDTSAVAISNTLKLLGKYPKVQDKVYQELREVFGNTDRLLVKEDLMKLKYLEQVVKESLRLFPPVPFVIRKVLETITLPSGRTLPAGSGIVGSIWGLHRDPKYWGPDAEHFDPDRFLPERFNVPPSSYMPFSSGPRNCPGSQYAFMSVKTALAAILRQYKVVGDIEDGPIPKIRMKLDVMMKAVDGYDIALERRRDGEVHSARE